jgi:hypothetical protein
VQGTLSASITEKHPVVQQGDYTDGRYTYPDSVAKLGVALELRKL